MDEMQAYYKQGGDGYSMAQLAAVDSRPQNLINALKELPVGARVLDIGCGDSYLAQRLPKLWWVGIDIHDKGNSEHCVFIERSLTDLPYPLEDNNFDAVVCSEVLEHLFTPEKILKEIYRVLKPNAFALITVPNFDNIDSKLQNRVELLYDPKQSHTVEHIRLYSPSSLKKLLESCGLNIVNTFGNSPHISVFFHQARHTLKAEFPHKSSIDLDILLGKMFPDVCPGLFLIAQKGINNA